MNISKKGIELIKRFEGCKLKAYKPVSTEKYFTIGYGHYSPDIQKNDTITPEQAENLLRDDIRKFEQGVERLVTSTINQNQFDALVSFAFNLGLSNLKKSTLLKLVNANPNDEMIRKEFAKWVRAGGKILTGLVRRREAESELYFAEIEKS